MNKRNYRSAAFIATTAMLLATTGTGRPPWLTAPAWAIWGAVAALTWKGSRNAQD